MDCCRTVAPPRRRGRQGHRPLRLRGDEGVALGEGGRDARGHPDPQLPRSEGIHARRRQADRRRSSRRSRATYDDKGRRQLVPTGEPDVHIECDDVLVAIGQENAFPWIERDIGLEFDRLGHAEGRPGTMQSTLPQRVLRRRCRLRPEEHHLGGRARPRGGGLDRPLLPRRGRAPAPAAAVSSISQKMGIHEWSYDNDISLDQRTGCRWRPGDSAPRRQGGGRARLRASRSATRRRSAASTATSRRCSRATSASSATPASTSARSTASPSRRTGPRTSCAGACTRRRRT